MANIVLITAAGVGSRTHQFIPKQFISIKDKPIIIYTLEKFQQHPEIDKIVVVCLEGWDACLKSYAKQFGITKLEAVVYGGATGYDSINNGLNAIGKFAKSNDIVLIHDGNRPATDEDIITDCIAKVKEKGVAITCIPTTEVVYDISGEKPKMLNRDNLLRTQTPHASTFSYMKSIYDEAKEKGITSTVAFCSLLTELGKDVYFVNGSEKNFKITVKDDIDLFKGMLLVEDSEKGL